MASKLSTSVADFIRGYTATQRITEAYLARKDYFQSCNRLDQVGFFRCQTVLNCHNTVNDLLNTLNNSSMENFGKRLYKVTHRGLWNEAMEEAGVRK